MTKVKGKKRTSKSKTSAIKLSNKHLNKLGKQGKLKKEVQRKKLKQKKLEKLKSKRTLTERERNGTDSGIHVLSEEILEEDDCFYANRGLSGSFLSALSDRVLGSKDVARARNRNRADTDENEEVYEHSPRKKPYASYKKMILPIKTKHGVVQQVIDDDLQIDDTEMSTEEGKEDNNVESAETVQPLPVLKGVDLYLNRQKKLLERKQKIAALSSSLISNPNENMKKLRELLSMLKKKEPDVCGTVHKYVIVSLLEVFKDLIPGYYIRMPTEKEEEQKMKKETKDILDHELTLVSCYKEYLEFLDRTAKGPRIVDSNTKKQRKRDISVPGPTQQVLKELAIRCLCELLSTHPHFNYRNNIVMVLVPYSNNRNSKISDMVCDCIKKCFRDDKGGSITLELTKNIGKMIKAREFRVQPKVLETFLSLKIKEVSYTDPLSKDESSKGKKNDKLGEKLSRKEKKRKKKLMFVEKDLQETKATEDKKLRLKMHTETIQAVFLTYFRILKKATSSVLFPSVLEGLARFAHLISVDFFEDLFAIFNNLIAEQELSYRESLHCVQTAFTILCGQGSVLNIDPVIFYKHLYQHLYNVHAGNTSQDVGIVLQCLDVMISKRKRQMSQQRVLAFIKRLSTLCLQQTSSGMQGLLAAVRSFMMMYNYTDILLDNDSYGSGAYLPQLQDPEHCYAHNTALWECTLLKSHFDRSVRQLCACITNRSLSSGEGNLPAELRKPPIELFHAAEKMDMFPNFISQKASRNKIRQKELVQKDVELALTSSLQSVSDSFV